IAKISESKIQLEISGGNKQKIIIEILQLCIPKIEKLGGDKHENFGAFAESLLHYLLTNALIPSQRKITLKNTEIDIVIPDSRTLTSAPKDSLVLYFAKTDNTHTIAESLARLENVQPHKDNIRIVAKAKTSVPYKTYDIDDVSNFATILDDIDGFLASRPQSKFRIFRT
ncbi:MAG: hypothetical protein ACT4NT_04040, partial [Nitrososphaerota archaeon]